MKKLTAKQEAFSAYVASGMALVDAYRHAYPDAKAAQNAIRANAHQLARHPGVKQRIAQLRSPAVAAVQTSVNIDLTRVLFENARIGFSDIRRLLTADGKLKQPHEWDDDTAAAISSVKVRELFGEGADGKGQIGYVTEIKLWDKGAALDRLMKNLGGYEEDNRQKGVLDGIERDKVRAIIEAIDAIGAKRTGALTGRASSVPA